MSASIYLAGGIILFLLLLLGGMWIPFAIGIGGILMLIAYEGTSSLNSMGFIVWGSINSATLSSVPLFILMAEVLLRSGISGRFYEGLSKVVWMLPGGLLQTNIAGSALFSAISGSSVATAAAIGSVALPRLKEEGYDTPMACGSVAAGGTLGILIPPSIAMIIYASFTEVSVAKLFIAGVIPGALMTLIFMTYIAVRTLINPAVAPTRPRPSSVTEYVVGFFQVLPVVIIIGFVLGTIYMGIATPTESAGVGAFAAFIIAMTLGRPSLQTYIDAVLSAVKVSASILLISLAAYIFAYAVESTGVAGNITDWVVSLELNRYVFLALLFIMYAVMGCLVDSIGMIVLTVPLLVPILNAMGIDLIWFGVMLVVAVELGQITPPMGINLFVVDAISKAGIGQVIRGAMPYYFLMALFVVILVLFPELALWLPAHL
jgi:tripartite ATP-independent transporter DctM subunit